MSVDSIKSIFFEKQEAQLCAQHALNMLLQQELFNPVDLATIAHRLDSEENEVLESGKKNKESQNMDDSGFFSVQVIAEALKTYHLELISILHPGVKTIKEDPLTAHAFICNRSEHWFVIRKFGRQWFELNSCREGPLLHTDTYVSLFLTQLTGDGYSIFVIQGALPDCEAEHVIMANPVKFVPPKRKQAEEKKDEKKEPAAFSGSGQRLGDSTAAAPAEAAAAGAPGAEIVIDDDDELQEAIRRSLAEQAGSSSSSHQQQAGSGAADAFDDNLQRALALSTEDDAQDRSFQLALAMSMQEAGGAAGGGPAAAAAAAAAAEPGRATAAVSEPSMEDVRAKRLKRFE